MCPCPPQGIISRVSPRTATIVVAASNSATKSKIGADYVCDGVHDEVEIQNALNSLPAGGGKVVLLEGTYHVEATINLNSNQTLSGCGRNTILTTSTRGLTFLSAIGSSTNEKTNIVIKDLQIDDTDIRCGIHFSWVYDCFIENVYLKIQGLESDRYGIRLENVVDTSIIGNWCQSAVYGIYAKSPAAVVISNNIFFWNDCAIYLDLSDACNISDNICEGCGTGIYLYSSTHNNISDNYCGANDEEGIYLYSSSSNSISGNVCEDNGYEGIYLRQSSDNTISDNIVRENGYDGISLDYLCNNNVVSDNTVQNNGYNGISLDHSSDNVISGNLCQGNGYDGIAIDYSSSNIISDNESKASGYNGIILDASSGNTVSNNICVANSQDTDNTYDDIFVRNNSDYNNIQNNICRAGTLTNKPRYGICIDDSTCDGNVVTNNDIYNDGFGTGAFRDAGTGTVTTAGNRT